MKKIIGQVSLDHKDSIVFSLDQSPEIEDEINIRLFGRGLITGVNDNYKDTNQTWIIIKWESGEEQHFQYIEEK